MHICIFYILFFADNYFLKKLDIITFININLEKNGIYLLH